ncbi:MAG TPA: ABC transporter permease [Nocardioidaceae bacterium]|nr:ABC transporter permease [Nocardioidaceae bacterium]
MTALTGVGPLIRFVLRRDRVFLPVWIVAIVVVVYASLSAVRDLYTTPSAIAAYATTVGGSPASIALAGPPFAMDQIGGILIYETSLTALLGVALMAVFTVVRHTRREEDAGRVELLGSTVVSPHAVITSAVLVSALASVLVGGGISAAFLLEEQPLNESLLYGASIAALGVVFTGVAAVAAQLMSHGRGAVGVSLAFLAVVYGVRAIGDVGENFLVWLSPMGWSQQVGVYELDRWWPLALSVGFTVVLFAATVVLEARRDLGSGVLTARPGPASASRSLGTVVGFAWRLQRGALLGWVIGVFGMAVLLGSFSESIENMIEENPAIADVFAATAAETLVDSYMAISLLLLGIGAAGYAVSSALRMRSEESSDRLEPILATGVSRGRWFAGNLLVTLVGTTFLVASGGLGLGISYAMTSTRPDEVWAMTWASLVYLPAVLLVTGLAVLLFGLLPRASGLAWVAVAFAFIIGWLGSLLEFPQWVDNLSPFTHTPAVPAESVAAGPLLVLALLTVAAVVMGWAGFRRRDIG